MVLGPGKVIKIQLKHFLAVPIRHYKNCTPKTVGMFRLLNRVIRPRFQLFLFRRFPGPKKSWNFFQEHFYSDEWETKRNASQIESVYFGCQNWVIWARFPTFPARVWPRPEKVIKIQSKQFLVVPMGNDKKCTPKSVPMFRALNRVIWAPFLTFPAPVVLEPKKVVKIRPKHFFAILIGNDKNCTQKSVGMFRV